MKFNEAAGALRSMEGKTIKEENILEIVQEWLMVGKQTVAVGTKQGEGLRRMAARNLNESRAVPATCCKP
jgi:hypothetical protein